MKIKSLTYQDKARRWRLNRVHFDDLTLLVGASGVGKTQILNSIFNLRKIAQGASLNGVHWELAFEIEPGSHYEWRGEFEDLGYEQERIFYFFDDEDRVYPKILNEHFIHNGKVIIQRDETDIYFNEHKTVKLAQDKSVLSLIKDEPIPSIGDALRLIVLNDYTNINMRRHLRRVTQSEQIQYPDLAAIRNSDTDFRTKLYFCSLVAPEVFAEITQSFIEVFPFVQEVRIQLIDDDPRLREIPFIQLKESGVKNWIDDPLISSGMYRTLLQISALYLCADGTVFLIDEFENSLGINCIDELTSALMAYERDLQFIITSHHPYIINSIGYENWKLVTRKGGVVSAQDATIYDLGKSKHKAFTQLINLEAYTFVTCNYC